MPTQSSSKWRQMPHVGWYLMVYSLMSSSACLIGQLLCECVLNEVCQWLVAVLEDTSAIRHESARESHQLWVIMLWMRESESLCLYGALALNYIEWFVSESLASQYISPISLCNTYFHLVQPRPRYFRTHVGNLCYSKPVVSSHRWCLYPVMWMSANKMCVGCVHCQYHWPPVRQ